MIRTIEELKKIQEQEIINQQKKLDVCMDLPFEVDSINDWNDNYTLYINVDGLKGLRDFWHNPEVEPATLYQARDNGSLVFKPEEVLAEGYKKKGIKTLNISKPHQLKIDVNEGDGFGPSVSGHAYVKVGLVHYQLYFSVKTLNIGDSYHGLGAANEWNHSRNECQRNIIRHNPNRNAAKVSLFNQLWGSGSQNSTHYSYHLATIEKLDDLLELLGEKNV